MTLGPLSGLELTIAADPLIPLEAEEASDLFDHWINVVEGQGSRTVRTEVGLFFFTTLGLHGGRRTVSDDLPLICWVQEALPIALARLKSTVERQGIP